MLVYFDRRVPNLRDGARPALKRTRMDGDL